MRDPELVARAQRAATRLETAWERWRAAQDLADTPAQPVVGYVGYALKEPWGQPRAVIGFSADEAERLAEHLESGTATVPPVTVPSTTVPPTTVPPTTVPPETAQSAVQQWSGASKGQPAAESKPAGSQGGGAAGSGSKRRSGQRRKANEGTADRSLTRF